MKSVCGGEKVSVISSDEIISILKEEIDNFDMVTK